MPAPTRAKSLFWGFEEVVVVMAYPFRVRGRVIGHPTSPRSIGPANPPVT
jgi:hypothetical protein